MNVMDSFVCESRNATMGILLRLCLICGLVISQNACATTPGMKTVEWREEVKLSSGQIVIVERTQEYRSIFVPGSRGSWLFDRERIRATFQSPFKQAVTWEGKLQPLALDITDESAIYMVAVAASAPGQREYELPDGSYHVAFKYKTSGSWERISIDSVPLEVRPNLLVSTHRLFITSEYKGDSVINLMTKEKVDSRPTINRIWRGWKKS